MQFCDLMGSTSDLREIARLQLMLRTVNRRLKIDSPSHEIKLSSQEHTLHSLLSTREPKTLSEVAEIVGVDATEVYYLLNSLQTKKLVKAIVGRPIRFISTSN